LQQVGNNKKLLSVIVKADVSGSIEAIVSSLLKLGNDEVTVSVVHSGTGAISETDINLASVSNALVIGFNVRSTSKANDFAKEKGIEIRYYSIIYNILDDVKDILSGLLNPTKREETVGQAEVRNVFKLSTSGVVAGCYVSSGEIHRNLPIRLIRDGVVVYDGKIKALRRFKDDVKEVKNNFECGISIENYTDIKERDIIECYKIIEEKRGL
jgi:translation initiation factor IF-2